MIDQFEELFTLFVDPADGGVDSSDVRDWRLRGQFLKQLESVYCGSQAQADAVGVLDLPIRFVISLREDYVAHLDPVRLFAPEVNETAYRLGLLQAEDAGMAIRQPARHFGYTYPDALVREVIAALASDDGRLVEPSRLQIVCDKLWKTRERHAQILNSTSTDEREPTSVKSWVTQILSSFFRESLDDIAAANARSRFARGGAQHAFHNARMEILDILSLLITPQRTRNIVEKRTLARAPFRDAIWRAHLLDGLVRRRILRAERRLRGTFYEVAHEFLIDGILTSIDDEVKDNEAFARLRVAIDALVSVERGGSPIIPQTAFKAIDQNRDRLVLDGWARAAMLKTALVQNDRAGVREWAQRYAETSVPEPDELWERIAGDWLLTIDELRWLYAERERVRTHPEYGNSLERLMRSAIVAGLPQDRDLVHHWTYELTHVKA
jgi:hypothetical protein